MRETAVATASGPAASDQSPLSLYRAKLAAGELRADPAQALAAEKLETLYRALKDYQPQSGPGFWRAHLGFARGFRRSSARRPPMRLYRLRDVAPRYSTPISTLF